MNFEHSTQHTGQANLPRQDCSSFGMSRTRTLSPFCHETFVRLPEAVVCPRIMFLMDQHFSNITYSTGYQELSFCIRGRSRSPILNRRRPCFNVSRTVNGEFPRPFPDLTQPRNKDSAFFCARRQDSFLELRCHGPQFRSTRPRPGESNDHTSFAHRFGKWS